MNNNKLLAALYCFEKKNRVRALPCIIILLCTANISESFAVPKISMAILYIFFKFRSATDECRVRYIERVEFAVKNVLQIYILVMITYGLKTKRLDCDVRCSGLSLRTTLARFNFRSPRR